jgi:hypothetical protein
MKRLVRQAPPLAVSVDTVPFSRSCAAGVICWRLSQGKKNTRRDTAGANGKLLVPFVESMGKRA